MAKAPAKESKTLLDPMFFIPEGAESEFEQFDPTDVGSLDDTEAASNVQIITDETVGEQDYGDYSESLNVPAILGVVSQKIITDAAGNQVVDLTIEVEDLPGVDNYQLRVAKV